MTFTFLRYRREENKTNKMKPENLSEIPSSKDKQPLEVFCKINCSSKFCKIHSNTPVSVSFLYVKLQASGVLRTTATSKELLCERKTFLKLTHLRHYIIRKSFGGKKMLSFAIFSPIRKNEFRRSSP